MTLTVAGKATPLAVGGQVTLALRNAGPTRISTAPLMFGGFGLVDASRGATPYAGVDLRGKVVVLLANDPDFEAGRDLGFEGRRLVFAGRVGVKIEAAAKAGAVGVLVIHEDAAASWPFFQAASGDVLPTVTYAPLAPSALQFSSWLRLDTAEIFLRSLGLELEALKRQAREPGFRASVLAGATLDASGEIRATEFTSHNVIARRRGASRPGEIVLYGAHWDANGRQRTDVRSDGIRNGAVDNATGTATLLEVARAFAAGPRPARTVLFAAWTAEEKGLLGAEYYADHPLYPLATTAGVINLDPHVVLPAARDIELIGGGRTDFELRLAQAAGSLGLRVTPEPNPEAGWYFRSDHYPFAKRGVPSLAFRAGRDLIEGGIAAGNAWVGPYNAQRYHQGTDDFDPAWTFAGTAQEGEVAYRTGLQLANDATWPGWYPGNEYVQVRAASDAERQSASAR
jgi:Zn-dependent M28 family amino/carboxypeptidase